MAGPLPAIETLDGVDAATFCATLGPLFEDAPGFLGRLADRRPHRDTPLWRCRAFLS